MNTEYLTIQGDRWDTIAFKAYGDSSMFSKIQDANPNIPLVDNFEGGIKILIPIVEVLDTTNIDLLPPWKRVDTTLAQKQADINNQLNSISQNSNGSFDKSFD
jgi:phage tail protein X